jgi:hypothetical protein
MAIVKQGAFVLFSFRRLNCTTTYNNVHTPVQYLYVFDQEVWCTSSLDFVHSFVPTRYYSRNTFINLAELYGLAGCFTRAKE